MGFRDDILDLSRQRRLGPLSPWMSKQLSQGIDSGRFLDEPHLKQIGAALIDTLVTYRERTGVAVAVLGMSGGVDSALTAALLKHAVGRSSGSLSPLNRIPKKRNEERRLAAPSASSICISI